MNIVFTYKNIIVGGCEFLIYKLSKYAIKVGDIPIVLCKTIDTEMRKKFDQSNIKIEKIDQWDYPDFEEKTERGVIITFLPSDYFRYFNLFSGYSVLLYTVHYKALEISTKNKFIKKLYKFYLKPILKKAILHNRIVCMDEQTVNYTNDYYDWKKKLKPRIVRIPIDIVQQDEKIIDSRYYKKNRNILTIARAEFPFKGYLIGLIKEFVLLFNEYHNLTLTIISYGSDIEILKNELKGIPRDIRNNIELLGKTDYSKLDDYFNNCYLYIGMGTTVLDASQRYIPSITVKAYTYELVSGNYFFNNNSEVAYTEAENKTEYLIKGILELPYTDYFSASIKSRDAVIYDYDVGNCYQELIKNSMSDNYNSYSIQLIRVLLKIKNKKFE